MVLAVAALTGAPLDEDEKTGQQCQGDAGGTELSSVPGERRGASMRRQPSHRSRPAHHGRRPTLGDHRRAGAPSGRGWPTPLKAWP